MRTTMVILFALFAISAEAQQSIGSIDDVARIERGGTIHVSTAAAAEIEGTFIRPKGTVLTMTAESQPRNVPVSQLRQPHREHYKALVSTT